jgi:predicted RNase H-like HicB family nuclease
MFMKHALVIFEQGKDGGWGAYAPDLPGLGVIAETREEVDQFIREGLKITSPASWKTASPSPNR